MAKEEKNVEINEEKVDEDLLSAVAGHGRCTYLLVSLVALIVISPFGADSESGEMLLIVMSALTYVGGIYAISPDSRILYLIIGDKFGSNTELDGSGFKGSEVQFIILNINLFMKIYQKIGSFSLNFNL